LDRFARCKPPLKRGAVNKHVSRNGAFNRKKPEKARKIHMQNPEKVHQLLVKNVEKRTLGERQEFARIFYLLAEDGDSRPKISKLVTDLTRNPPGQLNVRDLRREGVGVIIESLGTAFADDRGFIANVFSHALEQRKRTPDESGPPDFHAAILISLFHLDSVGLFKSPSEETKIYEQPLMACLLKCLELRLLERSDILPQETSLLSGAIKRLVATAFDDVGKETERHKWKWNALIDLIKVAEKSIRNDYAFTQTSSCLEFVLVNDLCSKLFNTLALLQKMNLLSHQLQVVK
jgi:hypothetical protein